MLRFIDTAGKTSFLKCVVSGVFLKPLQMEADQSNLVPANKNFKIFRPKEPFRIYGVVSASFSTYSLLRTLKPAKHGLKPQNME